MDAVVDATIQEPLNLVKLTLGEQLTFSRRVLIKLRGDRVVTGVLHASAFDAHMNVVVSQAEESIYIVDVTDDGQPLPPRVERRNAEMLFVRGDSVILVGILGLLTPTEQ
nr:U6 snRNA-associated Sm-like protein LSm3 [Cryptococcus depauperatus CBS 7841]ODN96177.1 U6 snRNA-associated Sm-like protein LSm3 [Cryptococcus depauperatus CBS 7855]